MSAPKVVPHAACPECGSIEPVVQGYVKRHKGRARGWDGQRFRCEGSLAPVTREMVEEWLAREITEMAHEVTRHDQRIEDARAEVIAAEERRAQAVAEEAALVAWAAKFESGKVTV